jgi:hypothetical protein
MKTRADAKKLMLDIADVYSKSLEEIEAYWKQAQERKIIENGRERFLAAEPPEKIADTIRELKGKAYGKIAELKADWEAKEDAFFSPDGTAITDDMKLLNDVFNPSFEQLKTLADRYFNKNAVMEQAIVNFATDKDKYKAILALPRTQTKGERKEIIEFYDTKVMKPRYSETADVGGVAVTMYDYQNCRKILVDRWLEKIV